MKPDGVALWFASKKQDDFSSDIDIRIVIPPTSLVDNPIADKYDGACRSPMANRGWEVVGADLVRYGVGEAISAWHPFR